MTQNKNQISILEAYKRALLEEFSHDNLSKFVFRHPFFGVNHEKTEEPWNNTLRVKLTEAEINMLNFKVNELKEQYNKSKQLKDELEKCADNINGIESDNINIIFMYNNWESDNLCSSIKNMINQCMELLNNSTHKYLTQDLREKCSVCGASLYEMDEYTCDEFAIKTVLE